MKFRSYSSEAFVLSRKKFGEADRILVVFSKDFGKLHLLAKGIRKPKSRKRGHLEVFTRIKYSVSRTHGMELITEAETVDSYEAIRKDLKKVAVSFFIMEVVDKLIREDEKHDLLYELVRRTLTDIGKSRNLKKIREHFIEETLITLGFWPLGRELAEPDKVLEEILEKRVNSRRIGKKLLT